MGHLVVVSSDGKEYVHAHPTRRTTSQLKATTS
jgi:hypothetical protein